MLVQPLGERLGKAVGQRLQEDVGVIVVVGEEARGVRLDAVNADREAADPVARGIDEIGKAHVGAVAALLHLLAEEREQGVPLLLDQMHRHVVAISGAGPQAGDALGGEPLLADDPVEHRIGIGLERTGASRRPLRRRGSRDSSRAVPRRGRTGSSR